MSLHYRVEEITGKGGYEKQKMTIYLSIISITLGNLINGILSQLRDFAKLKRHSRIHISVVLQVVFFDSLHIYIDR